MPCPVWERVLGRRKPARIIAPDELWPGVGARR